VTEPSVVPPVSLVIPGRNAVRTLRPCLDAVVPLLKQGVLSEILFVDDGSTDETAQLVSEYPVRYLKGEGKGPGYARNLGWRAAGTPLVWFIDSDCVAEPDALPLLLPSFENPAVAGAGGSYGNRCPESLLACLIHEEIVQRHRAMPTEVNYLATFNVVYRRTALEQVGGFDEGNFNGPGAPGAEDIELAFRLHAAGHHLRFILNSRVGHYHPTRLRRYLRSQALHGYFRVWLYLHHRDKAAGDAYSGLVDHCQPPLAMLVLALIPLSPLGIPFAVVLLVVVSLLGLAQLPLTLRITRRMRSLRYFAFAPFGFVRSFARGLGMSWAVLRFLVRRHG
jgi:glycosyltransferase involved in cell wall biosynthesis